ncbi:hypothetical protein T484DRAFT_1930566 [Baffinella frigidus]|nr:hypothetical protein T484DRAFT_1930566 [Cryptophyta sp. CCMP2293]
MEGAGARAMLQAVMRTRPWISVMGKPWISVMGKRGQWTGQRLTSGSQRWGSRRISLSNPLRCLSTRTSCGASPRACTSRCGAMSLERAVSRSLCSSTSYLTHP